MPRETLHSGGSSADPDPTVHVLGRPRIKRRLLSDLVGSRRKVMLAGGCSFLVLVVPLFLMMTSSTGSATVALFVMAILMAAWGASTAL